MKDYLLFVDTETSSLPKNWNLPYSKDDNWPYAVQISWLIYNKQGDLIKQEDHYVGNAEIIIASTATKVHGITREQLDKKGEPRKVILQKLVEDIVKFEPLIVGHFMEFDAHILGADFYRESIENPIRLEQSFCTMHATKHLARNPSAPFLKLSQLYRLLFNEKLEDVHNALGDAKATAACYFELWNRGDITDESIIKQQTQVLQKTKPSKPFGCLPVLIFFILIISYLLL